MLNNNSSTIWNTDFYLCNSAWWRAVLQTDCWAQRTIISALQALVAISL